MTDIPSSNCLLLSDLSDDILGELLLYCDFCSAVRFCHLVSKSLKNRIQKSSSKSRLQHVWRLMYERHFFSPIETSSLLSQEDRSSSDEIDFVSATRNRRRLLFNLLQRKNKKQNGCFNLPNRYFFFKPIIPIDLVPEQDENDDADIHMTIVDPPPVIYECDSFILTSTGTSSELLFLDPFDGRLSIIDNIVSQCVASDEAMMEQAMFKAADAISTLPRSSVFVNWQDDEIAGACFDESIRLNHSRYEILSPPCQELVSSSDYFSFDVSNYFPDRAENGMPSEEFHLSYVGVDAKPILDSRDSVVKGTVVGLGRSVTSIQDDNVVCTEVTMWTKYSVDLQYNNKMVCRFPWNFGDLDFEGVHNRLFVSFSEGEGPANSDTVVVYPMMSWTGEDKNYFPRPLQLLTCRHPVVSIAVDSTGDTLVISTRGGTLEVWRATSSGYQNVFSSIDIVNTLRKCIDECIYIKVRGFCDSCDVSCWNTTTATTTTTTTQHCNYNSLTELLSQEELITFSVLRRQPDLNHLRSQVDSIFIPKHLPVERAGFVTLHYSRDEGSSLLLWKFHDASAGPKIVSLINLRLSSSRKPRIVYDGNRLIVFGEDHIGMIILVYQVSNGDSNVSMDVSTTGEQSGGVYNLCFPPQVHFANRIRHAALSGIDRLDTIHMTTNERFLIVNTKAGNLLSGAAYPYSEGLLVIDLKDQCKCETASCQGKQSILSVCIPDDISFFREASCAS